MLGGHLMEVQLYLLCQENFIFPGKIQIISKNNAVFGNHVNQCDHVFFFNFIRRLRTTRIHNVTLMCITDMKL